jgi:hypothetical protein
MQSHTGQNEQTKHRTSKGDAPKGEATLTPPTPASTKVKTWIFTRRARGTNDEGGEGAPQRCLHGVEVHPRMPSSPAKTKVVARLSPGAHRTQSRRRLSAKLAVVEQTLQHAAAHHHRICSRRPPPSTSDQPPCTTSPPRKATRSAATPHLTKTTYGLTPNNRRTQ